MALRNQPYLPLFVDDYLTDEKLNMCSAATQGIYIKILCIFHKSETYGGILLKQKDKQNTKQIENFALKFAKLLPFDYAQILNALEELLDEGVLIIDGDLIYQKRMVKDNKISELRAQAGKIGGQKKKFCLSKTESKSEAKVEAKPQANSGNGNGNVIVYVNESNTIKYSEDFENFWQAYPKKVGKGGAYRVWKKLKPNKELQMQILDAVERQKKSEQWKRDGGQYIPNPQTWLNQARWDDEISETRSASYGID